jgi:hypothetical protein
VVLQDRVDALEAEFPAQLMRLTTQHEERVQQLEAAEQQHCQALGELAQLNQNLCILLGSLANSLQQSIHSGAVAKAMSSDAVATVQQAVISALELEPVRSSDSVDSSEAHSISASIASSLRVHDAASKMILIYHDVFEGCLKQAEQHITLSMELKVCNCNV